MQWCLFSFCPSAKLDRRGRKGQPWLRRRAEEDGAVGVAGKELNGSFKKDFTRLGQGLNLIENENGVRQPVKPAGRRVRRGITGVQKLNETGEDDVAVPPLGQALIGRLLAFGFNDDVRVMLENGRVVIKRFANVLRVLVENGVVGNDIEDAGVAIVRRVPERITQAGIRLSAAGRNRQGIDARRRNGFLKTDIGNLAADAIDAIYATQMGLAVIFEGVQQGVPVRHMIGGSKRILSILKAGGVSAVVIYQYAQKQPANQSQRSVHAGTPLGQIRKQRVKFSTGAIKQSIQSIGIRNVFEEPRNSFVHVNGSGFRLEPIEQRRPAVRIQAIAQARVVSENAEHDNLRRRASASISPRP